MEVLDAMKSRRSCRSFKTSKISRNVLYKVLDAARWAPSAGNLQSWEFIIVETEAEKNQLASAALGQDFLATAPVVVVVCADTERSAVKYGSRGRYIYSLADACCATENILLAATSLGLGTCWVGSFEPGRVRDVLGIPEGVVPIAIIPIGYPADEGTPSSRTSIGNIVHFEKYGKFETVKTAEGEDERPPASGKPKNAGEPGILDVFLK
jgi:nitroreductase